MISTWFCDDCEETFTITVPPVSSEGEVDADPVVFVGSMPCAICRRPMRRVESRRRRLPGLARRLVARAHGPSDRVEGAV